MRKPAPGVSDTVPSRIRPTPVNLASAIKKGNSAVSQRPFKDRVMHLLALKPYKKPELLLRLQKDGLSPQDKDSLDSLLQQVNSDIVMKRLRVHLWSAVGRNGVISIEDSRRLFTKLS